MPKKPDLSDFQRENMEKLAAHLDTKSKSNFDMRYFATRGSVDSYIQSPIEVLRNPCGTICCAVGSGPEIGIEPMDRESWQQYAERCFGMDCGLAENAAFDFLFSEVWADYEPRPEQAARRIRFYLNNGVPQGFSDAFLDESIDLDEGLEEFMSRLWSSEAGAAISGESK